MIYDLRFTIYARGLVIALLALCGGATFAQTQPAEEFFHGGAQHYLSNNIPAALQVVTNGLQQFPGDEKLKKLYELLNQQQQQQQQNQDQQQQDQDKKDEQKPDQKQDQQNKDEKKDQQSKEDQQKKEEEKKQQEAKDKKEQEKKDQQQSKSGDKSKDKPEEKTGDPQQVAAHQMTPQEAKQLLDAQKDDEKVLLFQPQREPKDQAKQLKDW